jgi:hypothetical protein
MIGRPGWVVTGGGRIQIGCGWAGSSLRPPPPQLESATPPTREARPAAGSRAPVAPVRSRDVTKKLPGTSLSIGQGRRIRLARHGYGQFPRWIRASGVSPRALAGGCQ